MGKRAVAEIKVHVFRSCFEDHDKDQKNHDQQADRHCRACEEEQKEVSFERIVIGDNRRQQGQVGF